MTNFSIGGNVTDSVIVFGNNNFVVNVGDLNGSTVNIIKPSDMPKFSARPSPVVVKPRNFHSLLDRQEEFELVRKAYQLSIPVSVWGRDGVGKTSFLRYLTHHLDAGNFPGGLLYLNVSGLKYEDLLQALFDLFFDSQPSYKPTTTEIIHALQNLKAFIILDDVQIGRDEIASILDAVPSSAFLLTSKERSLWGEVEIVPLRGLPESEALQLFEKELSRPLSEQERETATKVCTLLDGHPLQILQAAALSRDCGIPVEDLLQGMESEGLENKSTAYIRMAKLNPAEKQILALLAAAGGNIVPLEVIKGIFKDQDELRTIERLVALGLVQSHSPRFSITDTLTSSIAATWDLTAWQDLLLNHAMNWLGQKPASALVNEAGDLLMYVIKNAGERKKWREVIQLGRALEKFMISNKRWQAWADILNLVLTAARALKDRKVEAWALHQLGSRALYLGNASEARTILTQAFNIRQAIGDKAGLAVTRHNLNTLNGIVTPAKGNTSGCRKYLTCGFAAVIGLVMILAVIIWLAISFISVPPQNAVPAEPVKDLPSDTAVPSITPRIFPTTTRRPTSTPRPTRTPMPPSPTRIPTNTPTDPPPTEVTIRTFVNALSNFCLDSNLEGSVYAIDCNGGDYQYWQIQGGRLVNVATGRCLDSNIDGFVYTLDCNGGDYQNWQRQGELLVNVATGLCLYGRGNDVLTFACSPPSSGTSDGPPTASPNWK